MSANTELFNAKAELLFEKLNGADYEEFAKLCGRYAAFISVSDIHEQAYVFRASGVSVREAWDKARAAAEEFIAAEDFSPMWVKGDVTVKGERAALADVIKCISKGYRFFFRRGIAFEDSLDTAFIESR